jgi:prevent-host-death family protein
MSVVKPVSDLRNKFTDISKIIHQDDEPVIITKNGESDMVVMSYEYYKLIHSRINLYEKLFVAENEEANGAPTYPLKTVFNEIRENLNAKKI